MKRLATAAIVIALTLSAAGCSGTQEPEAVDADFGTPTHTEPTGPVAGTGREIATVEELQEALETDYPMAAWRVDITEMSVVSHLGADLLLIQTAWGSDENVVWEGVDEKQAELIAAVEGYKLLLAPNVMLVHGDGTQVPLAPRSDGGAVPMQEAFDLPPAPQTPDEVLAWLQAVYGPGGLVTLGETEAWLGTITSIEVEDWGHGLDEVLVVYTNTSSGLSPHMSPLDRALQTTGSPLLAEYAIRASDGTGISGAVREPQAPGEAGWYYVPE